MEPLYAHAKALYEAERLYSLFLKQDSPFFRHFKENPMEEIKKCPKCGSPTIKSVRKDYDEYLCQNIKCANRYFLGTSKKTPMTGTKPYQAAEMLCEWYFDLGPTGFKETMKKSMEKRKETPMKKIGECPECGRTMKTGVNNFICANPDCSYLGSPKEKTYAFTEAQLAEAVIRLFSKFSWATNLPHKHWANMICEELKTVPKPQPPTIGPDYLGKLINTIEPHLRTHMEAGKHTIKNYLENLIKEYKEERCYERAEAVQDVKATLCGD